MLVLAVLTFSARMLFSDESVGYALGQTVFVTALTFVGLLIFVRRTGHL
jgi:hypothetical protein